MGGFGMFGMFAYIGGSPPVLIEHLHFSPAEYGMLFGASAAMFILASQISPRLLPRFGAGRILRVAALTYLAAAIVLASCAVLGVGGVFGIVPPIMVAMGCMGFVLPNAAVGALSRHATQAGSASALMGTMQFGLAALSGALVGVLADGTARPMAFLMLAAALAVVATDRIRGRLVPAGAKQKRELSSAGNN
jgi:DHA1 family bicyclomycin/chloramphenicol resistance-like MFS transporter